MRNKHCFILFFLLYLIPVKTIVSQEISGSAMPFIQYYNDEDYNTQENQIWSVIKDDRGLIYFGNNEGVLEFDGTTWSLIQMPNKSVIRSFAKDKNGRIYVGADNEIGYLAADSTKTLQYHSLKNLIPDEYHDFEDVWQTAIVDDQFIWRTSSYIFSYSEDNFKAFLPDERYHLSFNVKNEFYVRERGKGLLKMQNDSLVLIPNSEVFAHIRIYVMLPYKDNKFMIVTRENGFYIYDPTNKHTFEKPGWAQRIDPIIIESQVYCGINYQDDKYILGTIQNGLFIIDSEGNIERHLNTDSGLPNNSVYYLLLDEDDNLWLGLNNGIAYIILNSQFRIINDRNGLTGAVYYTLSFNNRIYTGNSLGVFYEYEKNKFRMVENSKGQTWQLAEINDKLYAANFEGLLELSNGKARNIIPIGNVWKITELEKYPGKFLLGTDEGFELCEIENNQMKYKQHVDGFSETSRYFVEKDNIIWHCDQNSGVHRMKLSDDLSHFESIDFYNDKNGLPSQTNNYVFKIYNAQGEQEVVFGTENGIYQFDSKQNIFIQSEDFKNLLNNEGYIFQLEQDTFGNFYYEQGETIGFLQLQDDLSYQSIKTPFLKIKGYFIQHIAAIDSSTVLFAHKDGLIKYNPYGKYDYAKNFNASIRKVYSRDSLIYGGYSNTSAISYLNYKNNDMRFQFSALYYQASHKTQYSFYLQGFDEEDQWTSWTNKTEKEYTNLPHGIYTFKVKARNLYKIESNPAEFQFVIMPPWYRTILAYIVYFVLFVFIVYLIVKFYTRKLEWDKIKLEKIIEERTREIRRQNKEILVQNTEISQQKEEIQTQAENLAALNLELKKLSVVAQETDNGVIITDAEGNFEWINDGLVRMIGYTFDEFVAVKQNNIFKSSTNPDICKIYERIKKTKQPEYYQSQNITKSGKKLWMQTTLTPILNKNNEIIKFIAIESNITALKEAGEEIERKNADITDSITYAKRIQDAMLPTVDEFKRHLEDSFILFLPKDIVSGDFYWFTQQDDAIILAVADCTGHGVPGAFMSLIGNSFLNKIVNEKNINSPEKILDQLKMNVLKSLHKKRDEKEALDGMDISIVKIDKQKGILEFSSAMNPIYIIRGNELIEFVADKIPIGIYELKDKLFTKQSIKIQKGDQLYLFTDGYADQFGCENNKKYMYSNFKKLLMKGKALSMPDQKNALVKEYQQWKGDNEQVDDILVVGIQL